MARQTDQSHARTSADDRPGNDAEASADEQALFRATVGPVAAVNTPRRAPSQSRPSTQPCMREADEQAVLDELLDTPPPPEVETGDELHFARAGLQHRVMNKLRRGHYRCQAELDLHGMVVDVARQAFAEFLHEATSAGYGCVRIVHGKGNRSGHGGPVLKTRVAGWLRQRDEVLAFASTPPNDGGTGAVYVLLRRR
ncbi:DNA mismatch repair protein MutS [Salinisphaera sp. USBA-960]|nr:DNA mismatch repair protein MutS [Salifodinibacter halophilus]NNC26380.1 DNA mismatch repair protein MutS [Salifodinibacter halophilus]